ncbi:hypothetical protein ARMGADRAFT_1128810 [Armillaria gallica]|uniref:Uncharacterized protein n=1 Tax=Armillaria gallica TaxID=47427 RepID=A0A2H3CRW1_ARMGA|nr:hypothetical protein ARMGADRAFT_1128810 [Armillaria gallica]
MYVTGDKLSDKSKAEKRSSSFSETHSSNPPVNGSASSEDLENNDTLWQSIGQDKASTRIYPKAILVVNVKVAMRAPAVSSVTKRGGATVKLVPPVSGTVVEDLFAPGPVAKRKTDVGVESYRGTYTRCWHQRGVQLTEGLKVQLEVVEKKVEDVEAVEAERRREKEERRKNMHQRESDKKRTWVVKVVWPERTLLQLRE